MPPVLNLPHLLRQVCADPYCRAARSCPAGSRPLRTETRMNRAEMLATILTAVKNARDHVVEEQKKQITALEHRIGVLTAQVGDLADGTRAVLEHNRQLQRQADAAATPVHGVIGVNTVTTGASGASIVFTGTGSAGGGGGEPGPSAGAGKPRVPAGGAGGGGASAAKPRASRVTKAAGK